MNRRHVGHTKDRSRGGAISLLLTLLVIGLLAYFALKSTVFSHETAGNGEINCTNKVSELVNRTHGVGAEYQAGYEALPDDCRKFAPPPMPGLPQSPGGAIGTVPDPNS
jgi:hypothetical protein